MLVIHFEWSSRQTGGQRQPPGGGNLFFKDHGSSAKRSSFTPRSSSGDVGRWWCNHWASKTSCAITSIFISFSVWRICSFVNSENILVFKFQISLYKRNKENNTANNDNDGERDFEGPPTSCKTLAKLGYTLNGYYLIKGKDQQSKSKKSNKIQVAFCRFKQKKFSGEKLQQMGN